MLFAGPIAWLRANNNSKICLSLLFCSWMCRCWQTLHTICISRILSRAFHRACHAHFVPKIMWPLSNVSHPFQRILKINFEGRIFKTRRDFWICHIPYESNLLGKIILGKIGVFMSCVLKKIWINKLNNIFYSTK